MSPSSYFLIALTLFTALLLGGCSRVTKIQGEPAEATIKVTKTTTEQSDGTFTETIEHFIELFNDAMSPNGMTGGILNGEPYVTTSGSDLPFIQEQNPMLAKLKWWGYIIFAFGPVMLIMKFTGFPVLSSIPWAGPLFPVSAGLVLIWLEIIIATLANILITVLIIAVLLFVSGYLDNVVRLLKGKQFEDPKPQPQGGEL